jgi:hypothetical protein
MLVEILGHRGACRSDPELLFRRYECVESPPVGVGHVSGAQTVLKRGDVALCAPETREPVRDLRPC